MLDYRMLPPGRGREIYREISEEFNKITGAHGLQEKEAICRVVPRGSQEIPRGLANVEAAERYFDTLSKEQALTTGKDMVIRCVFEGHFGESSTDAPMPYKGQVRDASGMVFGKAAERAVFFAVLNAVYNFLGLVPETVNCCGEEPKKCGEMLADYIRTNFGKGAVVAHIGYKAEHIQACSKFKVYVSELEPELVGKTKFRKKILGSDKNEEIIKKANVAIIAGRSIVNGTLPRLLYLCETHRTEPIIYGVTAAAAARILNLKFFCPFAHRHLRTG